MSNQVLVLAVKKKWFDLIKSGDKVEEYREITNYWKTRLGFRSGYDRDYKVVEFRNGYGKKVPSFKKDLLEIVISSPDPKWGEEKEMELEKCFILRLGDLL